jgi:hypothetical protein
LGAENDAKDLKAHAFFKDVNWEDIENKIQDGPYVEKEKIGRYSKDTIDVINVFILFLKA